jgi:hypothetical protein
MWYRSSWRGAGGRLGVDLFDQRLSHGALEHKTLKWRRKLAIPCIILAIYNACILHNAKKKIRNLVQVDSDMVFSVDDLAGDDNPNLSARSTFLSLKGRSPKKMHCMLRYREKPQRAGW